MSGFVLANRQQRTGLEPSRQVARKVMGKTRRFGTGAAFRVPMRITLTTEAEPLQRRFDDDE